MLKPGGRGQGHQPRRRTCRLARRAGAHESMTWIGRGRARRVGLFFVPLVVHLYGQVPFAGLAMAFYVPLQAGLEAGIVMRNAFQRRIKYPQF